MIETQFSERFENELLKEFFRESGDYQFLKYQIIQFPDSQEHLEFGDSRIGLFLKWRVENERAILVIALENENYWEIQVALKIHAELFEQYAFNPMVALALLTRRFGKTIRVRGIESELLKDIKIRCVNYTTMTLGLENPLPIGFPLAIENPEAGIFQIYYYEYSDEPHHIFHIVLAFCIDTYAYSQWLFGWNNTSQTIVNWLTEKPSGSSKQSRLELSANDIEDVFSFVAELHPEDKSAQTETAKMLAAYLFLGNTLGNRWAASVLAPEQSSNFLNRDWQDADEYRLNGILLIQLATAIYRLQDVPDFYDYLTDAKADTQFGEKVESLWFQFFVPDLLVREGYKIIRFLPKSLAGRTPDLLVEFRSHIVPVEIKAKLEGQEYRNTRDLSKSIRDACKQLPDTGPGVVFLLIPTDWTMDETFVDQVDNLVQIALLDNRNCNAVFVWWYQKIRLQDGSFGIAWTFRSYANKHPKSYIPKITDLVSVVHANDIVPQSPDAPFLNK